MLHKARIARRGRKVTYEAECATLPDGTIFADGTVALLIWKGQSFEWTFDGYTLNGPVSRGLVRVLTPEPLVALLSHSYCPEPHDSLGVE